MSNKGRPSRESRGSLARLPSGVPFPRERQRAGPQIYWALCFALLFSLDSSAQGRQDPGDPNTRQGVPGQVQIPGPGGNQDQNGLKNLTGQVVDKQGGGLAQAVVHLKNKKTLEVKTYISDDKGNYRFNGLDPDADFQVHAEYRGAASRTRSVSSFDDRKDVYLLLEIETSKQ